jgi:hypothetical protein
MGQLGAGAAPMGGGVTAGDGVTMGGGGISRGLTRADRNNNPGNIKFGEFAKRMGATGADDQGHAIFPDRETGFKAAETLLGTKGYSGLTLGQTGQRWAAGDPGWARAVSKATGIPIGDVPTPEQRTQIARTGIPFAEGTGLGGGMVGGDLFKGGQFQLKGEGGRERVAGGGGVAPRGDVTGSGTIPPEILAEARKAALAGGPKGVQDYIRGKGYEVHSAWCGDFAAAVVKGAGGTPPDNPQIASNWRNFGTQVVSPEAGDIAVRRGARTGSTGSHVTVVDALNRERGTFTGLGGNQRAGMRSQFPTRGFEFFRADDDQARRQSNLTSEDMNAFAERFDATMSSEGRKGKVDVDVNFKGTWPGVKTNATADGEIFDKLKVDNLKQAPRADASTADPYSWAMSP